MSPSYMLNAQLLFCIGDSRSCCYQDNNRTPVPEEIRVYYERQSHKHISESSVVGTVSVEKGKGN